jgi:hypothetical protein
MTIMVRRIDFVVRELAVEAESPEAAFQKAMAGEYMGQLIEQAGATFYTEAVKLDAQCQVLCRGDLPAQVRSVTARIPTYSGRPEAPETSDPDVPVVITQAAGVQLILGAERDAVFAADTPDQGKLFASPAIFIEKQPDRWLVLLSSEYGGDPELSVYLMADGRMVVVPDDWTDKVTISKVPPLAPAAKRGDANVG